MARVPRGHVRAHRRERCGHQLASMASIATQFRERLASMADFRAGRHAGEAAIRARGEDVAGLVARRVEIARRRGDATPSTRRCLPEARCPRRSHITSQVGMFSYTGLTAPQVLRLRAEHHVYMLESGRLSMAGVTSKNVEPLAAAIAAVL